MGNIPHNEGFCVFSGITLSTCVGSLVAAIRPGKIRMRVSCFPLELILRWGLFSRACLFFYWHEIICFSTERTYLFLPGVSGLVPSDRSGNALELDIPALSWLCV